MRIEAKQRMKIADRNTKTTVTEDEKRFVCRKLKRKSNKEKSEKATEEMEE